MSKRSRRKLLVIAVVFGVSVATVLGITAFNENLMYFHSPTEVAAGEVPQNRPFRVGGLVVDGSVERDSGSLAVKFSLTDHAATVPISYTGILPDLFREGQGIVAMGSMDDAGVFVADEVLAKHDENYMPPEVAEALKAGEQVRREAAYKEQYN